MRKPTLSDTVLNALAEAERKPGWNNRRGDIQRFDIGCTLYVVPFRCWAYRRQQKQAAAFLRERAL